MELQFSELRPPRLVVQASSQALVEGELPLPEGRQGAEVLCADSSVVLASAAVGEGAVTVEGRVHVELICREGDEVFAFSSNAAFRHSFPAEGAKEGMGAEAHAVLQSFTVEQSAALTVSAILDVECTVLKQEPLRVLSGIKGAEDLECKEEQVETVGTRVLGRESVRIREEISAPNAAAVLCASGVCQVRDVQVGGDTAISEGTLTVTALCVGADGKLFQLVQHVPVTLETALDEIGEDTAGAFSLAQVEAVSLAPMGDSGIMSVEACITVQVEAPRAETAVLPLAAYVPSLPLACTHEQVQLLAKGAPVRFRYGASETLNIPEGMPECSRVVYSTGRAVVTSVSLGDGRLTVEGLLFTRVLYQTEGNILYAFTEDIPFYCETAAPGPFNEARAEVCVASASASGAGRSVGFTYTLLISAQPYAILPRSVVTGMEEAEREPVPRGVVIYFAGAGETLFDVGCRFNLSRRRLLETNPGLGETLGDGQKIVLMV